MTNTEHTPQKKTRNLTLMVLAMLLALSLSLLAGQQRANAVTFPGIYTVNSTVDAPDPNHNDNTCDANLSNVPVCTLRAAIEQANAHPGADAIRFAIPGSGVHTIHVNSSGYGQLPTITDTVTIDGYTQGDGTPGDPSDDATVNTLAKGTNAVLKIELDGSQVAGSASGLHVDAPDVVVKGLVINRFLYNVWVDDAADHTKIQGNFIGTYPSGTKAPAGSGNGVTIADHTTPAYNVVGGSALAARNLISGNSAYGVLLAGSNYNGVQGNLIGTQRDGKSPLGNGYSGASGYSGVAVGGSHNLVGGGTPDYANTIAFNKGDGIETLGGWGNDIDSNSVFSNGGLGINLVGGTESTSGATANDKGDADTGSNDLQNKPVLNSAKKSSTGKTVVKGTLNSNPNQDFRVQFFSNPKGTNEGKKLLGSKYVSTDGSGNVSFTFATTKKVSLGQNVTATATDRNAYDTSEFSAPRKVVAS